MSIILYKIGYYSIFIIPVSTVIYLYFATNIYLTLYYICYWISNHFINTLLKHIIKHPRPSHSVNIIENDSKYDPYGMPSGHAQHCLFTLSFLIEFANKYFIVGVYILSFLAPIQRLHYRKHTITQLFVGCVFGTLIGQCSYLLYKNSNKMLEL